jgi:Holliday junction resolvase RusA-like endonuclease
MVRLNVVTDVWVAGRPATKGSLDLAPRAGGGTYVRESVAGSKDWRRLVAHAVSADRRARGIGEPTLSAVGVRVLFVLPVPIGIAASTPAELVSGLWPSMARVGDVDKLTRNVLDAMQDAGAYRDDTQVCKALVGKVYADGTTPGSDYQGARVQCWELTPWEMRALREVRILP